MTGLKYLPILKPSLVQTVQHKGIQDDIRKMNFALLQQVPLYSFILGNIKLHVQKIHQNFVVLDIFSD